ncbi:MAG: energy transducer TonB [Myxococcales bacterium]|nr:energy transducer TonB [Myxococcales bacterium]
MLYQFEGLALWLAAALAIGSVACGGSEKKTEASSTEISDGDDDGPTRRRSQVPGMDDDDDDDDDDDVSIEGLKGHLDPYDIQTGVGRRSEALARCFQTAAKRKKFLGGQVELSFTVARDGSVKSVNASKSSVGSWKVEKCLLGESQIMKFKKPKGGEAEFSLPLDFEARRIANWWSEEKAEEALGAMPLELSACAGESSAADPKNVWVTLYLGNRGVVESVGFASPHKDGIEADWADCAATKVSAWTLTDPLGKIAKLGFRYNPE